MVIRLKKPFSGTIERTERSGVDPQQLLWLLLLGIAYLLRDLAKLPMPDIVFTALCATAFLFLSTGSAMGVYMFTSALTVPDFEIRFVYLGVLVVKCILQRKKLSTGMILIVLGLTLLEMVNMMLFSTQGVVSVLYTVAMRLTYFALPLFWFSENYSKEDYHRALLCYVAGVVLGGFTILWITVDAIGWELLLNHVDFRLGKGHVLGYETQSAMLTTYNSNQLAVMFSIVTAIVISLMDKRRISKWVGVLMIAFSIFMVFLTKSRTGILLLVGVAVIYYWVLIVQRKKILSGLVFFIVMALLIAALVTWFPNIVKNALDRFRDEDITNGRDQLFAEYIAAWSHNAWVLLFGYGAGSYRGVVLVSNSPHSAVTDILIGWGLAGAILVLCVWVAMLRKSVRTQNKGTYLTAYLPAIIAIVCAVSEQYLTTGYPHMRLCFLILAAAAFGSRADVTGELVEQMPKGDD